YGVRRDVADRIGEAVAQPGKALGLSCGVGQAGARGGAEPRDCGHIFGACAGPALLAAATDQRLAEVETNTLCRQRACPLWSADLVGGESQRVGAERIDVEVHSSGKLHRVTEDAPSRGMDEPAGCGDRLNDASFVVCTLQRQQDLSGPATGGLEPIEINPSIGAQWRDLDRRSRKSVPKHHAWMLARANNQPIERRLLLSGPEAHIESGVRGLGPARDKSNRA